MMGYLLFGAPVEGRAGKERVGEWPLLSAKVIYLLFCLAFERMCAGQGMAADGVRKRHLGIITPTITKIGMAAYARHSRKRLCTSVRHPGPGLARRWWEIGPEGHTVAPAGSGTSRRSVRRLTGVLGTK